MAPSFIKYLNLYPYLRSNSDKLLQQDFTKFPILLGILKMNAFLAYKRQHWDWHNRSYFPK